jgi:hypothetical protein
VTSPSQDELNKAIRDNTEFQRTNWCLNEAWDEARDRMPEHLTSAILDWFIYTGRYDTVFEDWQNERQPHE